MQYDLSNIFTFNRINLYFPTNNHFRHATHNQINHHIVKIDLFHTDGLCSIYNNSCEGNLIIQFNL